jgi:uncharacterized protein (TIGR02284 family)
MSGCCGIFPRKDHQEFARFTNENGTFAPEGRHEAQVTVVWRPMNSTINETVDVLNDLTETLKDGENGFRTAAKDVKAPELAQVFEKYANQRREFAAKLQARVAALGAKVEKSGSVAGTVHRGWINLKSALSTNEPQSVLEEAERGEDVAVESYRKAQGRTDLDTETRALINAQFAEVKAAHDHVRNLRDSGRYRKK